MNLQIALRFAKLGWKLFPSIWKDGHKPYIAWSKESSSDPKQIKTWAEKWPSCYFCVACQQSGITVIDVDDKKGKNGSESLFTLELEHEILPDTLVSHTPSGGYHYIFNGLCGVSVEKLGPGLDTPVMIPLPGSSVKGKGTYKIHEKHSIAVLPQWVVDLVGKPKERTKDRNPAIDPDLPHYIADATAYLQTAPPSLEGSGGDGNAYKVACRVRDFGISESICFDLMWRFWNERCEPPWDAEELERKIRNAYQYANTAAGERMPEADFDVIHPKDAPRHIREYRGDPPPRDWIIENWLPAKEITSLYGDGGLGKSLLALQVGLSVAGGGKFLDIDVSKKAPVLYIACEDTNDELHRRLHSIRQFPEYDFLDYNTIEMLLWSRAGKEAVIAFSEKNRVKKGPFADPLFNAIQNIKAPDKLVILDTLADIFAGDENDRATVNYFIKVVLGSMVQKHNATVLLIGHPSKAGMKDRKDYYSGSTAWNNAVRNRLALTVHDNKNLTDYRVLQRMKANYAPMGDAITLQWVNGILRPVEESGIVDEAEERNTNLLLNEIEKQAKTGRAYGTHHHHVPNIFNAEIKDTGGEIMEKKYIQRLLTKLVKEDLIEIIKGQPRGNGIRPKMKGDNDNGEEHD